MSDITYLLGLSIVMNFLFAYIIINLVKRISVMQKGLDNIAREAGQFQRGTKKFTSGPPKKK